MHKPRTTGCLEESRSGCRQHDIRPHICPLIADDSCRIAAQWTICNRHERKNVKIVGKKKKKELTIQTPTSRQQEPDVIVLAAPQVKSLCAVSRLKDDSDS